MNSPTVTLTTEADFLDFIEQEPEVEVPTLPLKLFASKEEFEQKVLALRMEYEVCKPVGNFF